MDEEPFPRKGAVALIWADHPNDLPDFGDMIGFASIRHVDDLQETLAELVADLQTFHETGLGVSDGG